MVASAMNFSHLGYVSTKLNFAKFEWGTTLFVSLGLFILGLYLAVRKDHQVVWKWLIGSLAALYILFTGVYLAADYFTGVGFDYKVIYHLQTGLKGAGFAEYIGLMIWMGLYCFGGLISVYLLYDLLGRKNRFISRKLIHFKFRDGPYGRSRASTSRDTAKQNFSLRMLSVPILLLALITNPLGQDIYELVRYKRIATKKISDFEFYAQPENIGLTTKKNVVFLYLESLERTYFDEDIFPDLVPNLSKLESQNIGFRDLGYTNYVGWTIAGMVATQCGVPLYTSSHGNAMSAYDSFMPNALCMGDILKKNGYDLTFMNGGDTQFAGKDKFYKTHGFDTIKGKKEHREDVNNEGLYNLWGLHDDRLFDIAYSDFLEKSALGQPFGLFVLTVGTHHPHGHVSNSCEGIKYQDGTNPMLNAVKCSDVIASEFVNKIIDSAYAKDTLIVVLSDHLAMKNGAYSLLKQGERRNFFTIIDPNSYESRVINRPASSMDVAPTVLSFLGFPDDALGFGRNLLGTEATLMESKGIEANNFIVSMRKTMQAELWEYPNLSEGLQFDSANKLVKIGNRSFKPPFLIELEENNAIKDMKFFKSKSSEQNKYFEKNAIDKSRFLWVDNCELIESHISLETIEVSGDPMGSKICAYFSVNGLKEKTILNSSSKIFSNILTETEGDSLP